MSRDAVIDIDVHLHHETPAAVLVSLDGDNDNAVWVPKSRCEIEPSANGRHHVLTTDQNTAEWKGLI